MAFEESLTLRIAGRRKTLRKKNEKQQMLPIDSLDFLHCEDSQGKHLRVTEPLSAAGLIWSFSLGLYFPRYKQMCYVLLSLESVSAKKNLLPSICQLIKPASNFFSHLATASMARKITGYCFRHKRKYCLVN